MNQAARTQEQKQSKPKSRSKNKPKASKKNKNLTYLISLPFGAGQNTQAVFPDYFPIMAKKGVLGFSMTASFSSAMARKNMMYHHYRYDILGCPRN
ncbi:hypothetical protein DSO57_1027803 [Entomophthora muscae]|uniref:Uncharacterized protein n=1 Tax=Entomophthora muscae TaxID=34485 RepID=A0ACC2SR89_9FUNG|nr:hypothetical protein DSO57_1027803 [Entomophthora muscae]